MVRTSRQKRRAARALRRRLEWLRKRLGEHPESTSWDYDRAELAALEWVVPLVERLVAETAGPAGGPSRVPSETQGVDYESQ